MRLPNPPGPSSRQRQATVIISLIILTLLTAFAVSHAVQPFQDENRSDIMVKRKTKLGRRQMFVVDGPLGGILNQPTPAPDQVQPAINTPLPAAAPVSPNSEPQGPLGLGDILGGLVTHAGQVLAPLTSILGAAVAPTTPGVHIGNVVGAVATLVNDIPVVVNTLLPIGGVAPLTPILGAAGPATTPGVNIGNVAGAVATLVNDIPIIINTLLPVGGIPSAPAANPTGQVSPPPENGGVLSPVESLVDDAAGNVGSTITSLPAVVTGVANSAPSQVGDGLPNPVADVTGALANDNVPSAIGVVTDAVSILSSVVAVSVADALTTPVIPNPSSILSEVTIILPSNLPVDDLEAPQLPGDRNTVVPGAMSSLASAIGQTIAAMPVVDGANSLVSALQVLTSCTMVNFSNGIPTFFITNCPLVTRAASQIAVPVSLPASNTAAATAVTADEGPVASVTSLLSAVSSVPSANENLGNATPVPTQAPTLITLGTAIPTTPVVGQSSSAAQPPPDVNTGSTPVPTQAPTLITLGTAIPTTPVVGQPSSSAQPPPDANTGSAVRGPASQPAAPNQSSNAQPQATDREAQPQPPAQTGNPPQEPPSVSSASGSQKQASSQLNGANPVPGSSSAPAMTPFTTITLPAEPSAGTPPGSAAKSASPASPPAGVITKVGGSPVASPTSQPSSISGAGDGQDPEQGGNNPPATPVIPISDCPAVVQCPACPASPPKPQDGSCPCPGRGYSCSECLNGWFCPPQETPMMPAPCGMGWPCYHCKGGWYCAPSDSSPASANGPAIAIKTVTAFVLPQPTSGSSDGGKDNGAGDGAASTPCASSAGSQPTGSLANGGGSGNSQGSDPDNGSANGYGHPNNDNSGSGSPANDGSGNGVSTPCSTENIGQPTDGAGSGAGPEAPNGNETPSNASASLTTSKSNGVTGAENPSEGSGTGSPSHAAPKAEADCSGWKLLGCFKDSPIRTLDGDPSKYFGGSMSNEKCIAHCASMGFKLAGTEYKTECWCGNAFEVAERLPEEQCNMVCDGRPTDICGGDWALTVYSADGQALSMPLDDDAGNGSDKGSAPDAGNGAGGGGNTGAGDPLSPPQDSPPATAPPAPPQPSSQGQPTPAPAGNSAASVTTPPSSSPSGQSQADLLALLQSIVNSLPQGSPDGGYGTGLGARDSGAGGNNAPVGNDNGGAYGGLPDLGPIMGPGPVIPPAELTGYSLGKKAMSGRSMKRSRIIGRRLVADYNGFISDKKTDVGDCVDE